MEVVDGSLDNILCAHFFYFLFPFSGAVVAILHWI